MDKQTVYVLGTAAGLIDKAPYLAKGSNRTIDPESGRACYCIRGALMEATARLQEQDVSWGGYVPWHEHHDDAYWAVRSLVPPSRAKESVAAWNDEPSRTKDEARDLLILATTASGYHSEELMRVV